jgi:5-methyltetrahydrofolate--homocysteine methyltransferase
VFLHHCVEAGLDLAMVNPNHITPYGEIPDAERELADDLVFNRREDALERLIAHFEAQGPEEDADAAADPTEGMEPEEALHFHILRRRKDGVEDWIDRSVEKIGAVPTLNDVLLPAMKEVGDKFGAGELILPFVLQSAEVMKRAVAQLEHYLDKLEGYTKGTVIVATVFGDVHDIGKSLVNTILTNNGYTVVDLGKQVPISTILDAAVEHKATAIGLSALLVSTSKQMPAAVQELHERGLEFPVLIGGAAINRKFGLRILYPHGTESDDVYEPGVFYCKDAFEGLARMDQLIDPEARQVLVTKNRDAAQRLREQPKVQEDQGPPTDDASVRSAATTDNPVPDPPFWGAQDVDIDLDEVFRHIDTHVLFKLHWGGRGVKGEAWANLVREDFQPRLERMWSQATYLQPRARVGYFPCNSDGNELIVWDPQDFDPAHPRELERLVFPRQPRHDRICLADFYRPLGSEPDVVALQAVTAGERVTELMARLEAEGEFAEQLFVHGLGVQTAEALAEWLHARVRSDLGIEPAQGRRYSWGYPACPEQSEHEKVFRLLDAPVMGLSLSGGYAVEPEQSTLAIVAHHPQAVYFGMRNGRLPSSERQAADHLIAGTDRDPTRMALLSDEEPSPEASADEPAMAEA